jgi:hypothetical protein
VVEVMPAGHPLLDCVIADAAADPEHWLSIRPYWIGASDAAKMSKVESVEIYTRNKVTQQTRPFTGSQFTRNGHAHEAGLMAWAGVRHNTRMFRHATEPVFAATPDGVSVTPSGVIVLGEAKIKHQIITGPTPAERRQVAWAQYVLGAAFTKWVWQVLDPRTNRPYGDPQCIHIDYDPEILEPLLEIARPVRAAMIAARNFERTP